MSQQDSGGLTPSAATSSTNSTNNTNNTDNIAAPQPPADPRAKIPEFFTIPQALQCISEHYGGREFKSLNLVASPQLHDGSVIEFNDPIMGVSVAYARLRPRNSVSINKDTGDMFMPCMLSDLSFGKSTVSVAQLSKPAQQ
jgi:hypothetical protein